MKAFAGRILIIVQNLPVPFDRRVWLEAKTLTGNGYKVSVICPKSPEYSRSHENLEGVAIYRYKMPVEAEGVLSYFFEFAYAWLAAAFLSLKVLWREGFDVIQACNPPDTYFVLGWLYKLFGKKFVFDHHDLCPEMFLAKYEKENKLLYRGLLFLEKLTLKTADIVISTNDSYKELAIKRGKKSAADIYVVRTGPDLARLKPRQAQQSLKQGFKHMICYLGEMCPQDGIDYLLRSADHLINRLGRKDVLFMLLGGGPAMPKFKAMSEAMGLQGSVRFTGRIPDKHVCDYLSTADVCVDPDPWSEWADHSTMNKVLEYMAFSKPIVAFDLKESKNSALEAAEFVEPNNVEEFSQTMSRLLDDPEKRSAMGRFGRKRIREQLAWEHTHKNLLKAYEKIFAGPVAVRKAVRTVDSVLDYLRRAYKFTPVPVLRMRKPTHKVHTPLHHKTGKTWPSVEKLVSHAVLEEDVVTV